MNFDILEKKTQHRKFCVISTSKWSKLGIGVSQQREQQREQPEEFNMKKCLEKLLQRQQEMERKFNAYLQAVKVKKDHSSKGEHSLGKTKING